MSMKKLLALVLALTMVLSFSAAAAYTVAPYGDAEQVNEDCEVAVQLLYSLNIMKGDDKGNFNPEATITRAEMAKMIYVILNYGKDDKAVNYTGAKIFSDVEAGAWYEGYVNYMATTKLVQGRPDGTFGPNAPITTAEAAKMLLTAIGYSAEARGYTGAGWDKQVLSDASIIGLLKDYNYSTTGYAPRQWVAVMVKNALTSAYTYTTIAPVVFNGLLTGINYDYDYDTMGWKYFGLYSWEGIIMANEYADLRDSKALDTAETFIKALDKDEQDQYFDNWTSYLTDIGEYRWGYAVASDRDISDADAENVVYVGGEEENTEFSTGNETKITKTKIDGIKLDGAPEYFLNFEPTQAVYENYVTGNGDWLRVVDNDGDGKAEYVFVTEFEMTEVTKVAKNGNVTLANKAESKDFVMSEDVAYGDIVLYTKIDGNEYVELADNFTGKVDKYTYKTRVLTVEGEDYAQSDIKYASIANDYFGDLENAAKKTEYTYYQDFFGHIRIYTRSKADSGELVLLTDAYYETNRNGSEAAVDAYLDGEITEVDVKDDYKYTDIEHFIERDGHNNKWDVLTEYWNDNNAWTNVARYTTDDEGVMSLYFATTHKYDAKGSAYDVKADYIDLVEEDVDAGETTYNGFYGQDAVKVQATKNTVYYYVDSDLNIKAVTGFKNSYDVIHEVVGINAMYAVATKVSSENEITDADGDYKYWIADVIVIETKSPVFNLDNNVVLGYNVVNKTVSDYADLEIIGSDAALDELFVTNVEGYDSFKAAQIKAPWFYFNTEDEDGESYIRKIEANYNKYGIYAETLNRVNKLDEYVVMADGDVLYYDDATIVYDMDSSVNRAGKKTVTVTTEDAYEDVLELTKGEDYILYVNSDDVIVYAVLVADSYKDGRLEEYDVARELYNAIKADEEPIITVENNLYSVKVLGEDATQVDEFEYVAYVCETELTGNAPRLEVVDNYAGAEMAIYFTNSAEAKFTGTGKVEDDGTTVGAGSKWIVVSDGIEYTVSVVVLSHKTSLTALVEGVKVEDETVKVYSTYANELNFVVADAVEVADGASYIFDATEKTITVTAECGAEVEYTVEFVEGAAQ